MLTMCGINGIVASDKQLVQKMNSQIRHRGPDDEGIFVDDHVSLGCCRLKVIDLSERGHQPMSNEEGDLWITFNGEIYNFRDVRKELEDLGYSFVSDSDTEVILQAVKVGEKLLEGPQGLRFQRTYEKFTNGSAAPSERCFPWNLLPIIEGLKAYSYLDS